MEDTPIKVIKDIVLWKMDNILQAHLVPAKSGLEVVGTVEKGTVVELGWPHYLGRHNGPPQ